MLAYFFLCGKARTACGIPTLAFSAPFPIIRVMNHADKREQSFEMTAYGEAPRSGGAEEDRGGERDVSADESAAGGGEPGGI